MVPINCCKSCQAYIVEQPEGEEALLKRDIAADVADKVTDVVSEVEETVEEIKEVVEEGAEKIEKEIEETIEDIGKDVEETVDEITDVIKEEVEKVEKEAEEVIEEIEKVLEEDEDPSCQDTHEACTLYDAEEFALYCRQPETMVPVNCCKTCKKYTGATLYKKRDMIDDIIDEIEKEVEETVDEIEKELDEVCVDKDPICAEYSDEDLADYCENVLTRVPDMCCKSCLGYLERVGGTIEIEVTDEEPELMKRSCENHDDVCERYGPKSLANYCNDESTGVARLCCKACEPYVAPTKLVKRSCENHDDVCERYGPKSLANYCNDESTGVAR